MSEGSLAEPAPAAENAVIRVRLDLAYDGTGFSGWATQPGQRTVQGELSRVLGHVLRLPEPVRLTVAGRTDTGVHARGQVAHADLSASVWEEHGPAALRRLGSRIVGVELADEAIRLADLSAARERTVVVLGHEHSGIPGDAMELVDVAVEIPMIGTGASLNVAVAGSLVLYRLAGFL